MNINKSISEEQFSEVVQTLKEFVAIPSISNPSSPDYSKENLNKAANFVACELQRLGFTVWTKSINDSPFFVFAEQIHDIEKPTILLYAHYDVQPVSRDKWDTDPFQMTEKGGRLYGRGVSDDKAGIIAIISVLKFFKDENLPYGFNIKILFEGEEEFGSNNMRALLKEEAESLKADAMIVMDGWNKDIQTGTVTNFARGVLTMTLEVEALQKPIHSGIGCLAPDPTMALAKLVSSLSDPYQIPGFMGDRVPLGKEEEILLEKSSPTEEEYKKEQGVIKGATLRGNPNQSVYRRILQEPSISITNMTAGEPKGGNSIQEKAQCTIGIRLTEGQDPDRIEACLRSYLETQKVLWDLPFSFERVGLFAKAWKTDVSKPFASRFLEAMKTNYPKVAVIPMGATIPLLSDFEQIFPKMEMFIAGIADPDTAAHSHNESQNKEVLKRAVNSLIAFLK